MMATEKRLIDANALMTKVKRYADEPDYQHTGENWRNGVRAIEYEISIAPTVDAVEVVHGQWIHTEIEDDNWGCVFHKWTCSNCDFSTGNNPNGTNYCPNCGAKMDGDGNG
jgi:hypothetical protein